MHSLFILWPCYEQFVVLLEWNGVSYLLIFFGLGEGVHGGVRWGIEWWGEGRGASGGGMGVGVG